MAMKIQCDLCGKDYTAKNNLFWMLELFQDEVYTEGHQKSLDAYYICKECISKLKQKRKEIQSKN